MSHHEKDWFLTERAQALAIVHLTRRDDLGISNAIMAEDVGLDYLVTIKKGSDRPSIRKFGIVLRSAVGPTTEERLNKLLQPAMPGFLRGGEYPYPVCLFYFTMEDNQGYYTWIAEPLVTEGGRPQLLMRQEPDSRKLDRPALDAIVKRVDEWYDAFYSSITKGDHS
jgi:hypothetical protein